MGRRLTLITGGARSGKSRFALELAQQWGGANVLFVATAEASDDEMKARIAAHRAARPTAWRTLETRDEVAQALKTAPVAPVLVLDCANLWAANVIMAQTNSAAQEMSRQLDELMVWYHATDVEMIIVTNEVGMGLVPSTELGRDFRDLLGYVNQRLAAAADEVYLLVAGLPIELKALTFRRGE